MAICGIGADDEDHIGLFDRAEILRAGRGPKSLLQAVAGWGVADARACIDVVVAEGGADHFLDDVDLLIGAARRADAANGAAAILLLDCLELAGRKADGLIPTDFAPGVGDPLPDHRT